MLIVVGTRKRPDGNLKAMFLLLDLWKKGIRDCFFDANLSEKQFEKVSQKIAKNYDLMESPESDDDEPKELVRLPKDTLVIEADAAIHLDKGVRMVEHEEASGGKAIDSLKGARAIHEIYIPKTGKWYLWARAFFEWSKDSYWIGMDDASAQPWDRDGGPGAIRICPDPDDTSKWHRWLWNTGPDSIVNTKQGINPAFFRLNGQDTIVSGQKAEKPVHAWIRYCLPAPEISTHKLRQVGNRSRLSRHRTPTNPPLSMNVKN